MTARKLIETAEEPYKTQIFDNITADIEGIVGDRLSDILIELFVWEETHQKHDYWSKYEDSLLAREL